VEFGGPRFAYEFDYGAVDGVRCGGEDAGGFVEKQVTGGCGLQNFPGDREVIELAERDTAIADYATV
jgi:hypothetical protein